VAPPRVTTTSAKYADKDGKRRGFIKVLKLPDKKLFLFNYSANSSGQNRRKSSL